jgi:hypothetical protein
MPHEKEVRWWSAGDGDMAVSGDTAGVRLGNRQRSDAGVEGSGDGFEAVAVARTCGASRRGGQVTSAGSGTRGMNHLSFGSTH